VEELLPGVFMFLFWSLAYTSLQRKDKSGFNRYFRVAQMTMIVGSCIFAVLAHFAGTGPTSSSLYAVFFCAVLVDVLVLEYRRRMELRLLTPLSGS
jgi:hypothetical protein